MGKGKTDDDCVDTCVDTCIEIGPHCCFAFVILAAGCGFTFASRSAHTTPRQSSA